MNTSRRTSELPSGREFRNRLLLRVAACCRLVATCVIAAYLFALLRLTREQWVGFVWINLASLPGCCSSPCSVRPPAVRGSPIVRCLDRGAVGRRERERARAALRGRVNLARAC